MVILPTAVGAAVVFQAMLGDAIGGEELDPLTVDLHRADVPSAVFVRAGLSKAATLLCQYPAQQGDRDLVPSRDFGHTFDGHRLDAKNGFDNHHRYGLFSRKRPDCLRMRWHLARIT